MRLCELDWVSIEPKHIIGKKRVLLKMTGSLFYQVDNPHFNEASFGIVLHGSTVSGLYHSLDRDGKVSFSSTGIGSFSLSENQICVSTPENYDFVKKLTTRIQTKLLF